MLKNFIWQNVLTLGFGLGIARFGINLAAAEMEGPLMLFESFPLAIGAMCLTIVVMIWGAYRVREANGNLIDLQTGFLTMFGIYAIAGIFTVLCNAMYLNWLRPEFLEMVVAYSDRLTSYGMVREYFSSLIFGGLLAMIFAFVVKREKVKVISQ